MRFFYQKWGINTTLWRNLWILVSWKLGLYTQLYIFEYVLKITGGIDRCPARIPFIYPVMQGGFQVLLSLKWISPFFSAIGAA